MRAHNLLAVLTGLTLDAFLSPVGTSADRGTKPYIEYSLLSHQISVTRLRAGNHDPEGNNEYYFRVIARGLVNRTDEKKKEMADRKHIVLDLGTFCRINLPSLSTWRPDEKKESIEFKLGVEGTRLRALTAQMMTKYKVTEDEVAIQIQVQMWEKNRKYYFLESDQQVSTLEYFPVPYTPSNDKPRMDLDLTIKDELGTSVLVEIRYDQPMQELNQSSNPAKAPGPG